MTRLAWLAALLSPALAALVAASCSSSSRGYLVVAVTSDMTTPKDVDAFALLVESAGTVKYDYLAFTPPRGSTALPATLVVPQPADPAAEVHVRVVAFRNGAARVVRDAFTTVPSDRSALLRVHLRYLDDGSALGALPASLVASATSGVVAVGDFDPRAISATCDLHQRQTRIEGGCASAVVDSSTLPDYDPRAVFGAGPCFDVAGCFAAASPVDPLDGASCRVTLPNASAASAASFALATHDGTGGCAADGRCFVLLDDGALASASAAGEITFVPAVCARIAAGDRLYAAGACAQQDTSAEVCSSLASDGGLDASPGVTGDASDCVTLLGNLLRGPTVPPSVFAGFDFSNDGGADGAFASGGAVPSGALLACADSVEPDDLPDGGIGSGYREATFGAKIDPFERSPVRLDMNAESRVAYGITLSNGYAGSLAFHSRSSGIHGHHTYVIGIDSGPLLRDGVEFPASWDFVFDNGVPHASPWVNEIYDALMATFLPDVPPVDDCYSTFERNYVPGAVVPRVIGDCTVVPNDGREALLVVQPLHLELDFHPGTNQLSGLSAFWLGGVTGCNTPRANAERMDFERLGIALDETRDGGIPTLGLALGGVPSLPGLQSRAGFTEAEANAVLCNGLTVPSPDPAYPMVQWGPRGELAMERNATTGVNYKLLARAGYRGIVTELYDPLPSGGYDDYVVKIGSIVNKGVPIAIDWSTAATAAAGITPFSNAWIAQWCGTGPNDADCVAAGNCTLTLDDGAGSSSFVLAPSAATVSRCGATIQPLGFVFRQGTTDLTQVFIVNAGGQ